MKPNFSAAVGLAAGFALLAAAARAEPPHMHILDPLAKREGVPVAFLAAVMMAESGGNPGAIGDDGCSVGLFQLNACGGMGTGMGDSRYDPATNAAVAAATLGAGWRRGAERGYSGESLVRFAYDAGFNPGGGWAHQGDSVVRFWRIYEPLYAGSRGGEGDPLACAEEAKRDRSLAKDCIRLEDYRTREPGFFREYAGTWSHPNWTRDDVARQYAYERNRDIDAALGTGETAWRELPHQGVFLTACAEESAGDPLLARDCTRFDDLAVEEPATFRDFAGPLLALGVTSEGVARRWVYERNRDIDAKIGRGDPDWRIRDYAAD